MKTNNKLESHLSTRLHYLKEIQNRGTKIVGYTPNGYVPEELIYASGAVPAALIYGGGIEPVRAAAPYLGRYLDPFCRAQIGYRIMKEPLYGMIDFLIVPVGDLHIRGIADSWEFFTNVPVYRLGVPHRKSHNGFQHYLGGLNLLKKQLETLTGTAITDKRLGEEIRLSNRIRKLLKDISLKRMPGSSQISGKDFISLSHFCLSADQRASIEYLELIKEELHGKEIKTSNYYSPRILLAGSTLALGDYKVIDLLEEAGASIVVEEFSEGLLDYWQEIDTDADPIRALARSYFTERLPCAYFRGSTKERTDFLLKLASDFKVDGIVWYTLMYRDSYGIESHLLRKELEKEDLPLLVITSEYSPADRENLRTRIETFVAMIRDKGHCHG